MNGRSAPGRLASDLYGHIVRTLVGYMCCDPRHPHSCAPSRTFIARAIILRAIESNWRFRSQRSRVESKRRGQTDVWGHRPDRRRDDALSSEWRSPWVAYIQIAAFILMSCGIGRTPPWAPGKSLST